MPPSPVGNCLKGRLAVVHKAPQRVYVWRVGKAATQAHHSDGVVARPFAHQLTPDPAGARFRNILFPCTILRRGAELQEDALTPTNRLTTASSSSNVCTPARSSSGMRIRSFS